MLPKKNRLTKKEYKEAFNRSKAYHNNNLVLLIHRDIKGENPKIGIVASKKIGKASTRNKVKRHIREIMRKKLHFLPGGTRIIVITKKDINQLDFKEIELEISKGLNLAGIKV